MKKMYALGRKHGLKWGVSLPPAPASVGARIHTSVSRRCLESGAQCDSYESSLPLHIFLAWLEKLQ